MKDYQILAERALLLRDKSTGLTEVIRITLGTPFWIEEGIAAACPVSIIGLVGRVSDIEGIDFINAIQLSISFVDDLLARLPSDKEVLWPDGEPYP